MSTLASTLEEVRERIRRAAKQSLNEQNTKATLIEPVLRALGWDVEDIEEVVREFKVKSRDKPVDYGLLALREPRLFVEAKPLGENLDDRRWASQIMGYASVAGVGWIVLTDGDEYRIYNSHATVAVEEKLFRSVRVSAGDPTAAATLELLSKSRIEENRIEVLWRAHFVDRQVRAALEELFSPDHDMLLVNTVEQRTKNLTVDEIRASIKRCRVTLDFPVDITVLIAESTRGSKARSSERRKPKATSGEKSAKKPPIQDPTTVADLIAAGLIRPPLQLTRTYKHIELSATILKDGRVRFGTETYDTLSAAACEARATLVGRGPDGSLSATNGWKFWLVETATGKRESVGVLRARLHSVAGDRSIERKAKAP
ncbi:MAG: type I restriction enzyme HsdR N-terminal domain-containing protein [Planctomycetota bacterium]